MEKQQQKGEDTEEEEEPENEEDEEEEELPATTQKVREEMMTILMSGVPQRRRREIWTSLLLCDVFAAKNPDCFSILSELPIDPTLHRKISIDLARTFPRHPFFNQDGQQALYRVLKSCAKLNPSLGYCQGMNFVCGVLFIAGLNEEQTFWGFIQLMKSYGMKKNFKPGLVGLRKHLANLDVLMPQMLPHLSKHFEEQGIITNMFAAKWFLTVFSCVLPLDCVMRVWDCFLIEGWPFIYAVGISLLELCEKKLLAASFEEILAILSCVLNDEHAADDSQHFNIRHINPDDVVKRAVALLLSLKKDEKLYSTIRATKKKKVGNI